MRSLLALAIVYAAFTANAFAHQDDEVDSLDPTSRGYLNNFCYYHPSSDLCHYKPDAPPPRPTATTGGSSNGSIPSSPPPGGNPTHDGPAVLVSPAKGDCLTFRQPTGACINSPTHKFLIDRCIANNNPPLSNASPCSQRYQQYWKMEFQPGDQGKTAVDVFRSRYGSMMQQNVMYEAQGQSQAEMDQSITVDYGPGQTLALQRNVKPGSIPSSAFTFKNFPSGTDAICISMNVFFPTDFVGNEEGGKLGYGIWGGDRPAGGGTSQINQLNGQGFVVRNTVRYNPPNTSLYSYHLNRGASGLWRVQDAPKCDSAHCCLYGDSSKRGSIPKGKWVRIEEEVVLNTTDQYNGYARLWIDGQQVGEITNMFINESSRRMMIKGLFINDMWGGNVNAPTNQAKVHEKYWLTNYTVYH